MVMILKPADEKVLAGQIYHICRKLSAIGIHRDVASISWSLVCRYTFLSIVLSPTTNQYARRITPRLQGDEVYDTEWECGSVKQLSDYGTT
jgi:hypothetical protein